MNRISGSYEALEGGFTTDALVDMSGGVQETFNLKKFRNKSLKCFYTKEYEDIWEVLIQARNKKSVICCNLDPDENEKEQVLTNGLVKGHAYIISTLAVIMLNDKEQRLLKCINPWGSNIEWKKKWGRKSSLWDKMLSETEKNTLLSEVQAPGQFWLGKLIDIFISNF